MVERIRIGVIFGGRSGEHEVSLMSARSVLSVLDPQKYEVTQIGITKQGAWVVGPDVLQALTHTRSNTLSPAALLPDPRYRGLYRIQTSDQGQILEMLTHLDVVFPVLHGTYGEDGTLQGLLDMADVAYVGAGVLGSAVGMDKAVCKDVLRAHNIPVVESILILRNQAASDLNSMMDQAEKLASYPLFVKPANMGSSVGVSKCRNRSDLVEGILEAARYDRRILIERGVNAREIEISVLGNDHPQTSLPGEVIPSDDFYSYRAKYIDEASRLIIPAPLSEAMIERIKDLAVRAFLAIDCAGMARVDFLLDQDNGEIYLSELNTLPGFTPISMYPKLWDASGLPYPELVDRLIGLALERKADRDRTEHEYESRR